MRTVGLTFPDEQKFVCSLCGKEYKSEAALLKHIAEKHPDTPPTEE